MGQSRPVSRQERVAALHVAEVKLGHASELWLDAKAGGRPLHAVDLAWREAERAAARARNRLEAHDRRAQA